MLLFSYIFPGRHFILFTSLIILWEISYDKVEFVKQYKKISLLAMFILFLIIDGSISKVRIEGEGEEVKVK